MHRLLSVIAPVSLSVSVPCYADICGGLSGNLVVRNRLPERLDNEQVSSREKIPEFGYRSEA